MIRKKLDVEWIELMVEVKSLGVHIGEVHEFLRVTVNDYNVDKNYGEGGEGSLNDTD
ncbi:anti-repressor SinI family protein [Peribacillus sp. NPDC097295]|uniref:anti-repressor SinI family protein n=1 Tax=Peribacillus sp. NPDC097295 TaxID=3364402 RepID=UPI0037FB587C